MLAVKTEILPIVEVLRPHAALAPAVSHATAAAFYNR
jgi:hypothetical protein